MYVHQLLSEMGKKDKPTDEEAGSDQEHHINKGKSIRIHTYVHTDGTSTVDHHHIPSFGLLTHKLVPKLSEE